jgi:hypothetical protein
MAKQSKLNENWNVQYNARDSQTNDDIVSLNMSWENRDIEGIMTNLNTWLIAIGVPLKVVDDK